VYRSSRILALGALAACAALFVLWSRGRRAEAVTDPSLVDGRVWIEKRPEKLTEYVHGAFFVSRANFGFFERGSSYEARFEMAEVSRKDSRLRVYFPQTGRDRTVTFGVQSCNDLPPFDLCLDFSENPWGGPKRYFGFSRPEDESANLGDHAARMRQLAP
jgi:hypothetical protein